MAASVTMDVDFEKFPPDRLSECTSDCLWQWREIAIELSPAAPTAPLPRCSMDADSERSEKAREAPKDTANADADSDYFHFPVPSDVTPSSDSASDSTESNNARNASQVEDQMSFIEQFCATAPSTECSVNDGCDTVLENEQDRPNSPPTAVMTEPAELREVCTSAQAMPQAQAPSETETRSGQALEECTPDHSPQQILETPSEHSDNDATSPERSHVSAPDAESEHSDEASEAPADVVVADPGSTSPSSETVATPAVASERAKSKGGQLSKPHPQLPFLQDVCAVELPDDCAVYDDCDTVRAKLKEIFDKGVLCKAVWLKHFRVNSNSLRTFYLRSGPTDGSTQGVYEVAYWFLERFRIYHNKPKSPRRLQNEKDHPNGYPHAKFALHYQKPKKRKRVLETEPAQSTEAATKPTATLQSQTRLETEEESDQELHKSTPDCSSRRRRIARKRSAPKTTVATPPKPEDAEDRKTRKLREEASKDIETADVGTTRRRRDRLVAPPMVSDSTNTKKMRASKTRAQTPLLQEICAVELPDACPVYDDCDTVRAKLKDLFDSGVICKAAWLNHLHINKGSLYKFELRTGAASGSNQRIYEVAYWFLERYRIWQDKPKRTSKGANTSAITASRCACCQRDDTGGVYEDAAKRSSNLVSCGIGCTTMDIDFEKYPPDRLAESVSDRPRENEDSVVPSAATSLVRTADADTDTEHSEKVDEAPKDSPRVETDSIHGTAHAYAISPAHSESTTWTAAIRKRTSQPHPRLPFLQEICAIELPNRCPVFDDCDTVRAKLRAFFDKGALSKAAWLKQHRVNSNSLRTFYLRSGPTDGSTQGVYEVAYWFLERYRLYQNNPKSPRRLQNEKDHPYGFPHARTGLDSDDRRRVPSDASPSAVSTSTESNTRSVAAGIDQLALMNEICAIELPQDCPVYDDCDTVRAKLKDLFDMAYWFLERYRLYQNKPKSPRRLQNEQERPSGFPHAKFAVQYHKPRKKKRILQPTRAEPTEATTGAEAMLQSPSQTCSETEEEEAAPPTSNGNMKVKRVRASKTRVQTPLLQEICAVELPDACPVYDDCDTVRAKLKDLFDSGVICKAAWLNHLQINSGSLYTFDVRTGPASGSNQGIYEVAYFFLERHRIWQDKPKSPQRLQHEEDHPNGFQHAKFTIGKPRVRRKKREVHGGEPAEPSEASTNAAVTPRSPSRVPSESQEESDQATTDEE
ncbi:TPA: hypothetical protein N0F65_006669 [Lagenidium giganteum]|uniref:DUF7726 domain-containing protein n=1 Tax=Lagenidium giganteum TaxID=4803 RepID=A0AAV2Z6J5_9STRA|nr:TPA: hypothetical protein N0F65_006669 [Lagenidium giganteum]